MGFAVTESAASVPDLIRQARQLRQDLDVNVARLQVTLAQSKAVADGMGWPAAIPSVKPQPAADSRILERLTPRELEVLRLIAEGKSSKEVAVSLGMAFRTAVCHRYRIFQKLHIHETASLVRLAVRAGLVKA